ncbi:Protein N-acetyltransferase, RimJ/RimL family [Aliiroseovarius sediminilitoris]|uniref:Protein N-acetyltransferase, RimJ/RimL family n=1 Tax=Aliiroseovarius sediminilitoris TaxID=1173584 RepID=A0A1I0MML8_9RHOB|nr:GNAT family N-acetyltransferase [Aliiroseovarius sediminilitoris]SEV89683.1 Protein N-acetyltransferase, RimJ/RimL family [Aliiroseovarius sediminilitoris]
MSFDDQPGLEGETIALRGMLESDRAMLTDAAKDAETWAGHPSRDRYKTAVFAPYFDFLLRAGGASVVTDKASGTLIGCSRYYVGPDAPEDIAIGFTFLNHHYWGGATNFEMKTLMLDHAFATFDRVWFHIDSTNPRSQRATAKLGAVRMADAALDLIGAGTPAPWLCFVLERDAWMRVKVARQGVTGKT